MEEGFVDVFSQAWVWVQTELGVLLSYIIRGTSSGKSWGIEARTRYPPHSSPGLQSFKTEMLQEVTGDFKVCVTNSHGSNIITSVTTVINSQSLDDSRSPASSH